MWPMSLTLLKVLAGSDGMSSLLESPPLSCPPIDVELQYIPYSQHPTSSGRNGTVYSRIKHPQIINRR